MDKPKINVDDIIKIGSKFMSPKAQVVRIYTEEDKQHGLCGDIEVIYNQNGLKAVKEDLIWNGEEWAFKIEGPNGVAYDLDQYPKIK